MIAETNWLKAWQCISVCPPCSLLTAMYPISCHIGFPHHLNRFVPPGDLPCFSFPATTASSLLAVVSEPLRSLGCGWSVKTCSRAVPKSVSRPLVLVSISTYNSTKMTSLVNPLSTYRSSASTTMRYPPSTQNTPPMNAIAEAVFAIALRPTQGYMNGSQARKPNSSVPDVDSAAHRRRPRPPSRT